jgi:hypothetical protein
MAGRLVINQVTCSMTSSGVSSSMPAWNAAVSTIMGAIAAAAGVAASLAATVGTGGAATPLVVILPTAMAVETGALTAAVMTAGTAAITSIGHRLPDQFYLTVNSQKVFPASDKYVEVYTGDTLKSLPGMVSGDPGKTNLERNKQSVWNQNGFIYNGKPGDQAMIELWDWDAVTSDDRLGFYAVSLDHPQPFQLYAMGNQEEDSMYIMSVGVEAS